MSIVERVKRLEYPLDQCVVIGSGLLDVLDLRQASDIDLAVSKELFRRLRARDDFRLSVRHGEEVLEKDDVEIWRTWGNGDELTFEALYAGGVSIDGVKFVHPDVLIRFKTRRNSEKDRRDVVLLNAYLSAHPDKIS